MGEDQLGSSVGARIFHFCLCGLVGYHLLLVDWMRDGKDEKACMTKIGRFPLWLLTLCILWGVPFVAWAQGINIQEVQALTFPTLALSSGTIQLTVSPLNSGTSGTGQIIGGTVSRGQYALSLTPGGSPLSISLNISAASTGNPNLTLDHFSGFYKGQLISSFPSSTLSLPATSPASTNPMVRLQSQRIRFSHFSNSKSGSNSEILQ